MGWEKYKSSETTVTLPALIMIVDELQQLIDMDGKSMQDRRLAEKLQANLNEIARLGRNAHVHELLATQSASASAFPMQMRNNIQFRNICGRVDGNISNMAINSDEGEAIPHVPGAYLGCADGETQMYQGYYVKLEEILALGTVKEGYNPKTGLLLEEASTIDFTKPPEDDGEEDNLEDIPNDSEVKPIDDGWDDDDEDEDWDDEDEEEDENKDSNESDVDDDFNSLLEIASFEVGKEENETPTETSNEAPKHKMSLNGMKKPSHEGANKKPMKLSIGKKSSNSSNNGSSKPRGSIIIE